MNLSSGFRLITISLLVVLCVQKLNAQNTDSIKNARLYKDFNGFYCKSVLDLEAPTNSSYDYLNQAIFIGTLEMPKLKPGEEPYVIIGVYKLL